MQTEITRKGRKLLYVVYNKIKNKKDKKQLRMSFTYTYKRSRKEIYYVLKRETKVNLLFKA
jgi:hypothetical protein